jgi:hypothetical protein
MMTVSALRPYAPLYLVIALSALFGSVAIADAASPPKEVSGNVPGCSAGRSATSETTFRQYVIRIFGDPESDIPDGCVEVMQDGARVWSYELGNIVWFELGGVWRDDEQARPLPLGKDVTGSGVPNIVIRWIRGRGSCCVGLVVVAVGDRFRFLTVLDLGRADAAYFTDLKRDSRVELVTWDPVWTCWGTTCAQSAAPEIVLQYRDGRFRLANDLMRRPPPTAPELEARLQRIAAAPRDGDKRLPSELWKQMLDLIYSGNAAAAWALLDRAWPAGQEGKGQFLSSFQRQLATSEYWPEIRTLNHSQIPDAPHSTSSTIPSGPPDDTIQYFPKLKTNRPD